jgi:hypothetical protein
MSAIPDALKEIVVFIFIRGSADKPEPIGTGFFVGVTDKHRKEGTFPYLVTARHVLTDRRGRYYPDIFIRMNKISGGSEMIRVPLSGEDALPIYKHVDQNVDVALLPLRPRDDIYQYKVLPDSMIGTREQLADAGIKEGDEVFFTGLFASFFGEERNYPVVRFGRVAMLPQERIPWEGAMLNLYLIECQSFGGNSGSPVFFYLGVARDPLSFIWRGPKFLLMGIMKGSYLEAKEVQVVDRSRIRVSFENAGIAAVVPAYYLHETLFSDELRKGRANTE